MNAAEIAQKLGGDKPSGEWWRCRCPAHNGNRSSLALRDTATGLAVKCFAGCTRWQIMAELERRGLSIVRDDPEKAAAIAEATADEKRRIANARDIWASSYLADATTQIDTYFHGRGIVLPAPPTIRICGMMYHAESGEKRPAMAARIDHIERGHIGTHLTFLAIDGSHKATIDPDRKMFGVVAGGAVRLAGIRPGNWLLIGEGIESTLAAMQLTELPGWAALSANGIESLVLPSEASKVMIAADNDENGRGAEAARLAAERWAKQGRQVRISMPPEVGQDFNDVLLAMRAVRHAG
jgi:putative DNA primase/helicase